MKKTWKIAMAGLLLTTMLASCGGSDVNNDVEDTTNLKIMILNRGYGTTWLEKIKKEYTDLHPEVNVNIEIVDYADSITQALNSGKKRNDYDLFFDVSETQTASINNTYSGDGGLANLDELYASTVPGESLTYGEKMNQSVKNELAIDGHYYSAPWATSTLGLYYNQTVLDSAFGAGSWSLPRTSDELLQLGKDFVAKGDRDNCFMIFIKNLDLISRTMFLGWWAQYEGLENYNNFLTGEYVDDSTSQVYGNDVRIYTQEGRLKALEAIEPLTRMNGDKLGYKYAATTQSSQFKTVQSQFYTSKNNFAIYPSGDWLEQESASGSSSVVKMMKLPVISSIVSNLPKKSIKDDATLSLVINAIDNGEASYTGVDAADFAKVKEARLTSVSMANFHIAYIPAYANAKKLATSFLLYMATDQALKTYKSEVKGGFLPFDTTYDDASLTDAEKSVAAVNKNANFVFYSKKNRLFYIGGALNYSLEGADGGYTMEESLNVSSDLRQYRTPQQYFEGFSTYYAGEEWQRKVLSKL